MKKKIKTIILYVLPYLYMVGILIFRRYQLSHGDTILTITQFEFISWCFNVSCILVVQILFARNKRMIRQKAAFDAVMDTARQIQTGLVPQTGSFSEDGVMISAFTTAARDVGGDFYDFFRIDEHRLAFVMADVSGKGIPAALFMMRAKTLIRTISQQSGGSTGDILSIVNDELTEGNDTGHFVTVWLGILDTSTGILTVSNAGHENPIMRHAGGPFGSVIYEHTMPLGMFGDLPREEHTVLLQPGDTLFVYTDGVTEAVNPDKVFFGENRLLARLNERTADAPEDVIRLVESGVKQFADGEESFDDMTMMAIRYDGPAYPQSSR